jgi:hypothetical protein
MSNAAAIWLSLHPSPASPASAFNRMRARVNFRGGVFAATDQGIQLFSLFHIDLYDTLLYRDLFHSHESAQSLRYGAIDSNIPLAVNDARQ